MLTKLIKFFNQKLVKFLFFGGLTILIYMLVLVFFEELIHLNYNISVSIAYFTSMLFNFLVNKFIVFEYKKSSAKLVHIQTIEFSCIILLNYLITLLFVNITKHFTGEVYSGSLLAAFTQTIIAYFIYDKLLRKIESHFLK